MKLKVHNLVIASLVILILTTRIPLFNSNAQYFFGDETFYKRLVITLEQSRNSENPMLFWQGVFGIYARPGYGILYSLPINFEGNKSKVAYGAVLNVVINSLIPLMIYLILKNVVNKSVAFFATIAIIFSITSVFYIRHMLPYDTALLIFLFGLYVYIRKKSAFLFGLASAFSFITYPSYFYYLIPIPFLIFVLNKFKIKSPTLFIIGFAVIVCVAQLTSLIIGAKPSYFEEARLLSGVVTQGDFTPAISFITEYIFSYDGYFGLILAGLAPFIIIFAKTKKFLPIVICLLVIFLLFEIFSHIIPKTVLYGRTIRPYYFLLVISGVIVFDNAIRNISQKLNIRYAAFLGLFFLVIIINWWPRFNSFRTIVYPADFRKEAENYLSQKHNKYILEDVYVKKETIDDSTTDPPVLESGKFYVVNPTLLYPYFGSLEPPCEREVLFTREHPLLFKPYHFEGFTRQMRGYLVNEPPKYQLIYCKNT